MDDFDEIPDLVDISEVPDLVEITTSDAEQSQEDDTLIQTEVAPAKKRNKVTPLTILTGWLGSGKTSLLHHLLESLSSEGKTVAILQNETSEMMGVEQALKLQDDSGVFGEMLEIKNGCVCCSVRSDFMVAIDTLLTKRSFDHVVVECSGIADVGTLASQLWVDDDLESKVYLDSIVCVLDATNALSYLGLSSETSTATARVDQHSRIIRNQLLYGNIVLLNKVDLIDDVTKQRIVQVVHNINAIAPVIETVRSRVDIDKILNLKALRLGSDDKTPIRNPNSDSSFLTTTSTESESVSTTVSTVTPLNALLSSPSMNTPATICNGVELYGTFIQSQSHTHHHNQTHTHTHEHHDACASHSNNTCCDSQSCYISETCISQTHAQSIQAQASEHGIMTIVMKLPHSSTDKAASGGVEIRQCHKWLNQLLWDDLQKRDAAAWAKRREQERSLAEKEGRGVWYGVIGDKLVSSENADVDELEPVVHAEETGEMLIYRMKGVLAAKNEVEKYYLQSVLQTYDLEKADNTVGIDREANSEIMSLNSWKEDEDRHSTIIVIGINLDLDKLTKGFYSCVSACDA